MSAGRLYYARYFEALPSTNERPSFTSELTSNLREAWSGAVALAEELPSMEDRRNDAYQSLQNRVQSPNEREDRQKQ